MKRVTVVPQFLHYNAGQWKTLGRDVVEEKSVSLSVNGEVWLSLMCTPTDLEALMVGFLFNEGIFKSKDEIELVQVCPEGNLVDIWLNHSVKQPEQWRRTSGCTGAKTSVDLGLTHQVLGNGLMLTPIIMHHWMEELSNAQQLYCQVGGVHTSILSDGKRVIVAAEDIGRHNTLDKIAGHYLLDEIVLPIKILITTGRISSEMIQKSARIGASIVISKTSASSLSIDLAHEWGITLIGYAQPKKFIVYTHPERILQEMN